MDNLEVLLDSITWAHRIVNIQDKIYVFRLLTLPERNIANYMYDNAKKEAAARGMLTKEQLIKQSTKNNLWHPNYQKDLEVLKEELKTRTKDLDIEKEHNKKRRTPTAKLKSLESRVAYLLEKIKFIEDSYLKYIELPSVEYYAEKDRATYSLSCATLTFPSMQQLWTSFESLRQEVDRELVSRLMTAFYSYNLVEESSLRKVARSSIWRIKWIASKKNRGVKTLFNREMYELSIDQFRLIYWSQIYDSAFESLDPPSDEVVDDDKLFDEWLEEQSQKRKTERKQSKFDKKTKSKRAQNAQEVGLTIDGYYSEDCNCGVKDIVPRLCRKHANDCPYGVFMKYDEKTKMQKVEDVQSTNSTTMRRILANEQRRLAQSGEMIDEQHLRKDVKTRAEFGMPTTFDDKGKKRR